MTVIVDVCEPNRFIGHNLEMLLVLGLTRSRFTLLSWYRSL